MHDWAVHPCVDQVSGWKVELAEGDRDMVVEGSECLWAEANVQDLFRKGFAKELTECFDLDTQRPVTISDLTIFCRQLDNSKSIMAALCFAEPKAVTANRAVAITNGAA